MSKSPAIGAHFDASFRFFSEHGVWLLKITMLLCRTKMNTKLSSHCCWKMSGLRWRIRSLWRHWNSYEKILESRILLWRIVSWPTVTTWTTSRTLRMWDLASRTGGDVEWRSCPDEFLSQHWIHFLAPSVAEVAQAVWTRLRKCCYSCCCSDWRLETRRDSGSCFVGKFGYSLHKGSFWCRPWLCKIGHRCCRCLPRRYCTCNFDTNELCKMNWHSFV